MPAKGTLYAAYRDAAVCLGCGLWAARVRGCVAACRPVVSVLAIRAVRSWTYLRDVAVCLGCGLWAARVRGCVGRGVGPVCWRSVRCARGPTYGTRRCVGGVACGPPVSVDVWAGVWARVMAYRAVRKRRITGRRAQGQHLTSIGDFIPRFGATAG